ncbi:GtrA family protein [Terribacillus halophilus]|jgi:putative flippase GtrA|uniref:GtrA family protein n=1 Tax=Terribacillus halophilus TaxID=361279 RepID=UPI00098598CA|nr:GtrA family protein [Terribacillus halophilus]
MLKRTRTQILQFTSIGVLNAAVDLVVLNILLLIWPTKNNLLLLLFNTISYLACIWNSYYWNSRFTFRHQKQSSTMEKGMFLAQGLVALVISNLVFLAALSILRSLTFVTLPAYVDNNIAKVLAMFLSSASSFLFMKYIVFKRKK